MIKVIAVDDEPPALDIVETFCKKFSFLQFEKGFTQTRMALQYLEKNRVDLLFLDINMPAMSGIAFYQSLRYKPMLIFTTSYSEYAVEGYDLGPEDYLLKPFSPERFERAVQRAHTTHNLQSKISLAEIKNEHLMLKADYGMVKVTVNDILFVEALDNYLKIYVQNQQPVVVRMTLKTLHEQLPGQDFIRVHRSYIVPFSRIRTVRNKTISVAGKDIPVGRSYEPHFQALFQKHPALC